MSIDLVKVPYSIKIEQRKLEFQTSLEERLKGVELRNNYYEVVLLAMRVAEEYWKNTSNKKYGPIKKECVMDFIKKNIPDMESEITSRMIESLLSTHVVKKLNAAQVFYRATKNYFFGV